jgi:hypothetical protein
VDAMIADEAAVRLSLFTAVAEANARAVSVNDELAALVRRVSRRVT